MRDSASKESFYRSKNVAEAADGPVREAINKIINHVRSVEATGTKQDKQGIDYIAISGTTEVFIDAKVRDVDPIEQGWADDVVLELYSHLCPLRLGWTLDPKKITDVVLWYWSPTGRYFAVNYDKLRRVTQKCKQQWMEKFKVIQNKTHRFDHHIYTSLAVCVPRSVIIAEIEKEYPNDGKKQYREGSLKADNYSCN